MHKYFSALFLGAWLFAIQANAYPIAATGEKLSHFLDGLNVTHKWLPHRYVNWLSGDSLSHSHVLGTHCSTFVAAAATKLGIPILRPPDQPYLLANAQFKWLRDRGEHYGWAEVESHTTAQQIANQGCFVVVTYANSKPNKPGHVVIVRPSAKSREEINARGPQIIQAGGKNFNSTTLSKAFRHYNAAFLKQKIMYYAHSTPFCKLLVKKEEAGNSTIKRL
jgi:hypothetical protein